MSILIVEDNRDSRELIGDIVASLGYTAIMAENGRIGLEKVDAYRPDLVILDVNMPEMDGFQVCDVLKHDPATAQIPIIMLTAQSDVESRITGLRLGADDYLPKPFHPRELMARITTRLRAKAIADDLLEQREVIRRTFERFVTPEIVEQLLEDPSCVRLGGAETVVSVLFADLEGFTTVSQYTEPPRLLEVLNSYHTLIVEHIKANGGTIDKFLGDGVMALYNTPLPQADHALRAVHTALDIRNALPDFHQLFEPQFRLNINFGINTGNAVVGNVGAPDLMDFTAIGDTVNLASRLQDLSENCQITVGEETYLLVTDAVIGEPMPPRLVRGREDPVMSYLILGLR